MRFGAYIRRDVAGNCKQNYIFKKLKLFELGDTINNDCFPASRLTRAVLYMSLCLRRRWGAARTQTRDVDNKHRRRNSVEGPRE